MCQLMKQNGTSQWTWQNPKKAPISELASIQGQKKKGIWKLWIELKVCLWNKCPHWLPMISSPIIPKFCIVNPLLTSQQKKKKGIKRKKAKKKREEERKEKQKKKKRWGLSRNRINMGRKLKGRIGVGAQEQMKTLLNPASGVPQPKVNFQTQV